MSATGYKLKKTVCYWVQTKENIDPFVNSAPPHDFAATGI